MKYTVEKGTVRTKTTWKSGAVQRGPGVRWFVVDPEGKRQYVTLGNATSKGGFFTKKAAQLWADYLSEDEAISFFPPDADQIEPPF